MEESSDFFHLADQDTNQGPNSGWLTSAENFYFQEIQQARDAIAAWQLELEEDRYRTSQEYQEALAQLKHGLESANMQLEEASDRHREALAEKQALEANRDRLLAKIREKAMIPEE